MVNGKFIADVRGYFDFLTSEYGFGGPYQYHQYHREYEPHATYVRKNIVVDVYFDEGYIVSVSKIRHHIPGLETGKILLKDINSSSRERHYLHFLDDNRGRSFYKNCNSEDEQLKRLSSLLIENKELLEGDFSKFSVWYSIKRKVLGRKKKRFVE